MDHSLFMKQNLVFAPSRAGKRLSTFDYSCVGHPIGFASNNEFSILRLTTMYASL